VNVHTLAARAPCIMSNEDSRRRLARHIVTYCITCTASCSLHTWYLHVHALGPPSSLSGLEVKVKLLRHHRQHAAGDTDPLHVAKSVITSRGKTETKNSWKIALERQTGGASQSFSLLQKNITSYSDLATSRSNQVYGYIKFQIENSSTSRLRNLLVYTAMRFWNCKIASPPSLGALLVQLW